MTESHAFGSNLTHFWMRSHSLETADLERSDMGGGGNWVSLLMYEEKMKMFSFSCRWERTPV